MVAPVGDFQESVGAVVEAKPRVALRYPETGVGAYESPLSARRAEYGAGDLVEAPDAGDSVYLGNRGEQLVGPALAQQFQQRLGRELLAFGIGEPTVAEALVSALGRVALGVVVDEHLDAGSGLADACGGLAEPGTEARPVVVEHAGAEADALAVRLPVHPPAAVDRVADAEAAELLQRAKKALADVEARIPQMEKEAREAAREEGKREGVEEGVRVGMEQGREEEKARIRAETENLRLNLQQIYAQIQMRHEGMAANAKKELLGLAMAVAERIVRAHVKVDAECVKRNIEAAVDLIAQEHKLQIFISPSEAEVVEEYVPQLKAKFPKVESVQIVPDMNIGAGCCIVRTKTGEVDARLETQIEEIERQLQQG